ncbi:MAG: hypothetical protein IIB44_08505 [Candidatus Marinimicrobia bacterium]|nr:hypothetical protein [Candidatus Neomarinimicrobiota bacterium]MCH8069205.1 hypothetical protein [Candidatus Neomarinimicrobiota bacterium]
MGFIEESDVRQMLSDETLVDEIITALVSDPGVLKELAEDVADELEDLLEEDPNFRKKIVEEAISNPEFKKSVIQQLVAEMTDD